MKSGIGIRHESPDAVVPLVVRVPPDGGTQGNTLAQLFHIVGDNGIVTGICQGDMSGGIDACPPHETAWGRKQEKRFPSQGQAVAGRNFAFSRPGSAEGPYAQKENCREASRSAQACLKVKKNNAAANNAQKKHKQNKSADAEKSQQKRFSPPAQTKSGQSRDTRSQSRVWAHIPRRSSSGPYAPAC